MFLITCTFKKCSTRSQIMTTHLIYLTVYCYQYVFIEKYTKWLYRLRHSKSMWRHQLRPIFPVIDTLLRPCWNKSECNLNSTGKGALYSSTAVFASTPRSVPFYQPPALPQNCLNWNGYFVFVFLCFLIIRIRDPELLAEISRRKKKSKVLIFWIGWSKIGRCMSKIHYLTLYVLVSRRIQCHCYFRLC